MTDSIEGKARRLLDDGRILLGFAGPKIEAAGSAPTDQSVPPPPVSAAVARQHEEEDKANAWFNLILTTVIALLAFFFIGYQFLRCFDLPLLSRAPAQAVAFEIMAYGLTGLGVLTSAVFLVICAVKICLMMMRQ
jgi:hypothetical protein